MCAQRKEYDSDWFFFVPSKYAAPSIHRVQENLVTEMDLIVVNTNIIFFFASLRDLMKQI